VCTPVVELRPGESKRLTLVADQRLLARFDTQAERWRMTQGTHRIGVGKSAGDPKLTVQAQLFGHRAN